MGGCREAVRLACLCVREVSYANTGWSSNVIVSRPLKAFQLVMNLRHLRILALLVIGTLHSLCRLSEIFFLCDNAAVVIITRVNPGLIFDAASTHLSRVLQLAKSHSLT